MIRALFRSVALIALITFAACTRHRSARRPVLMVPLAPSAEAPHSQATVPVGGAVAFEAEEVVSCEADTPDLVRAYATSDSLTLIGLNPGRTTLHLRLSAGDVFHVDLDIVNDSSSSIPRALAVGDQLALSLDGVNAIGDANACIRSTKSADATQLFILGVRACSTLLAFTMNDGTTKAVPIVVVGGTRLF